MKPWKRIDPTTVQKIGWRHVITKTFELPDGEVADYATYDKEGDRSASVLALTPDLQVVIARQFRVGPEKVFEELPGGYVNPGEDPAEAAKRELAEETGYVVEGHIVPLGSIYRGPYINGVCYYFLATNCRQPENYADLLDRSEYKYNEVYLETIDRVIENAKAGRMTDFGAVLMALDTLQKLKEGHEV